MIDVRLKDRNVNMQADSNWRMLQWWGRNLRSISVNGQC